MEDSHVVCEHCDTVNIPNYCSQLKGFIIESVNCLNFVNGCELFLMDTLFTVLIFQRKVIMDTNGTMLFILDIYMLICEWYLDLDYVYLQFTWKIIKIVMSFLHSGC